MRLSGIASSSFFVLTDRVCGAEDRAAGLGIEARRIPRLPRAEMSDAIDRVVSESGCGIVLLHFDRLVAESVFANHLTFNVHPSILPAFPGLDGVAAAADAGSLFQGATLHLVDQGMDTGPLVSQTVLPVPLEADLSWRYRLSFLQKTAVTLSLFDLVGAGRVDVSQRGIEAVDRSGLSDSGLVQPGLTDPALAMRLKAFFAEMGYGSLALA